MKTFTQLLEWVGVDLPVSAAISAPQAVDDVEAKAFGVEDPETLDKLNVYLGQLCQSQAINPYYTLNRIWSKLQIIGLNFDLRSITFMGPSGTVDLPLTQFGGRYGYLGTDGQISSDDGISNRIPGGLKLAIHWVNTRGTYTLEAQIKRGLEEGPFVDPVKKPAVEEAARVLPIPEDPRVAKQNAIRAELTQKQIEKKNRAARLDVAVARKKMQRGIRPSVDVSFDNPYDRKD